VTISDDVVFINYMKHWPAVKSVGGFGNATIVQCPSHMHTVLWGASQTVVTRLYSSLSSSPFDHISPEMRVDRNIPPHFPQFRQRPSNDTLQPSFSETTLSREEFLFVPKDLVVGVHLLSDADDTSFGQVMHMCFVDASNINVFREAIHVAGLVSAHDRQLEGLLDPLILDVTMIKQPKEISVLQFLNVDSSNVSEDITLSAKMEVKQRSDRRRRGAGGGDFKLWQDQNNWNLLVSRLTLPTPMKPVLVTAGRSFVTIAWQSNFVPTAADQSFFGFRIVVCKSESDLFESSDVVDASCQNLTMSAAASSFSSNLKGRAGLLVSVESSWFSTAVDTLAPNSSYVFSVSLLHDKSESSHSKWSSVLSTTSQTAPTHPSSISGAEGCPDVFVRFYDGSVQCVLRFKRPTGRQFKVACPCRA
jgi:hypothetical protein